MACTFASTAYSLPTDGTAVTVSGHYNRYVYSGRKWDNDIQQYNCRDWMYDASIGRFCSRDPIGYSPGPNQFAYVKGKACSSKDPSGLLALDEPPYPGATKNSNGCWQISYVDFVNWLNSQGMFVPFGPPQKPGGPPVPIIAKGCIGIVISVLLGGTCNTMANDPEYFANTTCFLAEKTSDKNSPPKSALDFECADGEEKVLWAKQGAWN